MNKQITMDKQTHGCRWGRDKDRSNTDGRTGRALTRERERERERERARERERERERQSVPPY